MLADPLTAGQGAHQLAIQPTWVLVIDVLDYAAFLQVSRSQTTCQSTVLFPEPLLIDQQSQAFLKAELARIRGFQLSAEGIRHSVQFHGVKFFNRLLIQHADSFRTTTAPAWWADRSNEA